MKLIPKKSLGQNFLFNKNIIKTIVEIGQITNKSIVLEIGPGTGNLTNEILKKNPKKFYAIEKDKVLYNHLKEKFNSKINIINDDVLNIDWDNFYKNKFIVFGNLPYNISAKLLINFIKLKNLDGLFDKFIFYVSKRSG